MKIIDNPKYKTILKKIVPCEKTEDLFDAMRIIDNKQVKDGSKVTNSNFSINSNTENKIEINYMLNLEGLIITGFVVLNQDGVVCDAGKDIEDTREDLPY